MDELGITNSVKSFPAEWNFQNIMGKQPVIDVPFSRKPICVQSISRVNVKFKPTKNSNYYRVSNFLMREIIDTIVKNFSQFHSRSSSLTD